MYEITNSHFCSAIPKEGQLFTNFAISLQLLIYSRAGHTLVKNLKSLMISGSDLFICKIQFLKHFAKQLFWFELILICKNGALSLAENTKDFQNL